MKINYLLLILILCGAVLVCLLSCRIYRNPSVSGDYTVIDIRYIHDLPYATKLKARHGQPLLQVVRILIMVNKKGERVILVGDASAEDTAIYYNGIEDDQLIFRLVPPGQNPDTYPAPDQILRFPIEVKHIELWGNHFDVLAVSPYGIMCRVSAPKIGN